MQLTSSADPGPVEIEVKHRRRWPGREISQIAARQRALITRQQLLALGAQRGGIQRALEDGRLHAVHRGVYAVVPPEATPPLAAEQAAVLAFGPAAYVSHHSAAAVWAIRPPAVDMVEVTVVGRNPGTRKGIRAHRVRSLDRRDTRVLERIPITSPARTLLDIARDLSERDLERAFDEVVARRLASLSAIRAVLSAHPRRPGWRLLWELAALGRSATLTRSQAEELFLELVRKAGLPGPEVNARVGRYEVDFCWRAQRVAVEIDGYAFHSSPAALERDHRRDAELQQMGFLVIRFSWRELSSEPEKVLVRVAGALALRTAA